MISGRKAIHEALVTKSVDFADRPLFYFNKLTNPRIKGALLIISTLFAKLHFVYMYSRVRHLCAYVRPMCLKLSADVRHIASHNTVFWEGNFGGRTHWGSCLRYYACCEMMSDKMVFVTFSEERQIWG